MILPVFPTISKSSKPSSSIDRKKGIRAKKSMRFMMLQKNLNFLGHVRSLMRYSTRKKVTTMFSMTSITNTTDLTVSLSVFSCRTSAVETMKVKVDKRTMEREVQASVWAVLLVCGYCRDKLNQ